MPQFCVEHLFQKARNYAGPSSANTSAACADPRVSRFLALRRIPRSSHGPPDANQRRRSRRRAGSMGTTFSGAESIVRTGSKKSPEMRGNRRHTASSTVADVHGRLSSNMERDDTFRYLVLDVLGGWSRSCQRSVPGSTWKTSRFSEPSVLAGTRLPRQQMYSSTGPPRHRKRDLTLPRTSMPIRFPA